MGEVIAKTGGPFEGTIVLDQSREVDRKAVQRAAELYNVTFKPQICFGISGSSLYQYQSTDQTLCQQGFFHPPLTWWESFVGVEDWGYSNSICSIWSIFL